VGEAEVQLGLTYGAAGRFDGRFGRAVELDVVVELVLWDRPCLGERPIARYVSGRATLIRDARREVAVRLIERGLERAGIDVEQHFALPDKRAFADSLRDEIPVHAGSDLCVAVPVERGDPFAVDGYVSQLHPHYFDGRRRRRRRRS
jgi:hypothetical protein